MDLPNLENYPVYILNVVPELSEEGNIQMPQQITSSDPMSYNFYIPNVEHHDSIVNEESALPIVPQKSNAKAIKKSSYEKAALNKAINRNKHFKSRCNMLSEKSVNELSSLLKDEDIRDTTNKVMKYDPTTDTNVIFHLVRPTETDVNSIEVKRKPGRPRKMFSESTKNETSQDLSSKQLKPEDIVEYPLTLTKSGRLCRPSKHLFDGDKKIESKKNPFLVVDNDNIGRKKVKYNVKSDYVCGRCGKIYLGQKRMQEHLERFPSHKTNATEHEVDSELQDIFQNFHETPSNITLNNDKKETHTQTEVVKDRHCGYMKSKKNLAFHLKQVMKHLKKPNLLKMLSGTISVWDLLYSILENGNLQLFSKELSTLIVNLKSISKSLKLVSKCESNPIDDNQMFVDDSLGHLFGIPNGSYSLQNIQNEYEMEQASDVWDLNSAKIVQPKESTPQTLNRQSSPIHLNLFDSQSSKVDFLLSSSMEESILCVENQAALESVDGLVSERLNTMSDHLHSNVAIIDYPIASTPSTNNVSQPDSFMSHGVYEVFSNDLNLVPTSTEDFIKSLEQFEPLNDTDNTLSTETRMLDFEDLQHTFHTS